MTHASGATVAIDAHAVTSIMEMGEGFSRVWTGEDSFEFPGTVAQISALLSDPPAVAVRFVEIDGEFFNPAKVYRVTPVHGQDGRSAIYDVTSSGFPVFVDCPAADVIAKLEGRAL